MRPAFARLWRVFEKELFPVPSTPGLFNQYLDDNPELDLPEGHLTRRENLKSYLDAFPAPPRILLVGEAAGPWGCRFSGIPFTSERQLLAPGFPVKGQRSGRRERPYSEASGTVLWGVLAPQFPRFFIWNAVPIHPHRPDNPLTIRRPNREEVKTFGGILRKAVSVLGPEKVLALGKVAESSLGLLEIECAYVRHPAQSGAAEFRRAVEGFFR